MNTQMFIRILIAAVFLGGLLGAVVSLVPQFTASVDASSALLIDGGVALLAGLVFAGYAKYVRWEQKRSKHDS